MALDFRIPSFQEQRLKSDSHHQSQVRDDEKSTVHQDFVESTKPDLAALKSQEAALRMELADTEMTTADQTPSRGVVQKILTRFLRQSPDNSNFKSSRTELQEKLKQNIIDQKMRSDILVMIHDHSVGELLDAQQALQQDPHSVETARYPNAPDLFRPYQESLNRNLPDTISPDGRALRAKSTELLITLINQEIAQRLQEHLAPVLRKIDSAQSELELSKSIQEDYPMFSPVYERIQRENAEPLSPESRITLEERTAKNRQDLVRLLSREIFPSPFNRPNAASELQARPVADLILTRLEQKRVELAGKRST